MDPGALADAQPTGDPEQRDPEQPELQWVEVPRRVGQLTPLWRLAFGIGWAAIIVGHAAVWESSRVIGLSTWWGGRGGGGGGCGG
jgi:hypothetical protein